jgi:hypothetical protein
MAAAPAGPAGPGPRARPPDRAVGRRSWEKFLAGRVSAPSHGSAGPAEGTGDPAS